MSLFPVFFRDMVRPMRMLERQMRLVDDIFPSVVAFRPELLRRQRGITESKEAVFQQHTDKFEMTLDVQDYRPGEVSVKTSDSGCVTVEGKHEGDAEGGYVSRQFVRKFVLPEGHLIKEAVSKLSSDGMLTISVPRKVKAVEDAEETTIPITHVSEEKKSE